MNTDETTRIEFAERQGWRRHDFEVNGYTGEQGYWTSPDGNLSDQCPDPTDRNHVHIALMGMSEEEWKSFRAWMLSALLQSPHLSSWSNQQEIIEATLKTPLPTRVSCYLEATKGRVK